MPGCGTGVYMPGCTWWVYARVYMVGIHPPGICRYTPPWVHHHPTMPTTGTTVSTHDLTGRREEALGSRLGYPLGESLSVRLIS